MQTEAEILRRLDADTKIRLVSGSGFWHLEALPEHGLERIMVCDGPHGLRQQTGAADHLGVRRATPATCFPTAATLGSTWDEPLLEEVGAAIGREARALGVAVVLGPGLNLKRHPAGGRNFEYFSEDPLISGKLAAALTRGIQSQGVGACLKHYAANNQETYRLVVDAIIDERTLRELYLTGFEIAVKESSPWTVMCAYNLVNGTYASEHPWLLTDVLRQEWGFPGLVMTDWGATNDRAAGIAAGLDLEMPGSAGAFDDEVRVALRDGRLAATDLDAAAFRVIQLVLRGQRGGPQAVDFDAHHELARQVAAAGSVLLTNDGTLPLRRGARLAVIGAFAEHPRYQGAGSSQVSPTRLDNALDALRQRAGDPFVYLPGYDPRTGVAGEAAIAEAVAAARNADVAIVFAGLPGVYESEGFDRRGLDLPQGHTQLIEAVLTANPNTVVVLANGGAVHLPWADRAAAILETYLGGQAGGPAVVDLLFGDREPGGRLAESFPYDGSQLAADRNFPGHPRQVEYREGLYVGYRFHESAGIPARFPFGHGLSYTEFEWSDAIVEGAGDDWTVSLTVTNTGSRHGSDVVQIYVRDLEASVYRPDRELRGFAKVHLGPGAAQRVSIRLGRRAFAFWDAGAKDWRVEAGAFEVLIAASATDIRSRHRIVVASEDEVSPAAGPSAWVATDAEFAAMLGRSVPVPRSLGVLDRNATLGEIEGTALGSGLGSLVRWLGRREVRKEFPDADDATLAMVEAGLREGPARALVAMSGGKISLGALDAVLDLLNGRWLSALRRVVSR